MKYIVSLLLAVFAHVGHAQYVAKQAFPNLPNFSLPLGIENAKDGTNRLFVVEQKGKIYVFQNSPTVSTRKLFIDLSDVVSQDGGEMGLLGLAFHPNYKNNGHFYVNYTTTQGYPRLTSVTSRFSVSTSNKDSADRSSELKLHTVQQPYNNHNGGCIKFGPDGYLYISYGDGGSGGDPQNRAQNLDSLLGKILRIDVDNFSGGNNFSIPASNPFASHPNNNRKQVFAYGLRNVWRMSFDPVTGKLWGGDVGQGKWEEIDIIESGKHYGWKTLEGRHCYSPQNGCDSSNKVMPVIEYEHLNGDLSVTGGHVYRGSLNSRLYGKYLYGDYGTGRIWMAEETNPTATNQLLIETVNPKRLLSTFGVDENGEIYFTAFYPGRLWTIEQSTPALTAPTLIAPKNDSINTPPNVTLSWNAVPGATSYEVTISLTPNYDRALFNRTLTGTSTSFNLQEGTMYYWKVGANGSGTISNWSQSRFFTTLLETPTLIAPKNDSINTPTTLTFSWNSVATATSYDIQISTSSAFTSMVKDSTVTGTSATFILSNGTQYYWRVCAKNSTLTSAWSTSRMFATVPVLVAPILTAPKNDSTDAPAILTFSWLSVNGAYSYQIQVSTRSDFMVLTQDMNIQGMLNFAFTLSEGQTYYWRVQAKNSEGNGPWSEVWKVTIKGITNPVVTAPLLISPNQTDTLEFESTPFSPAYNFHSVQHALTYQVQVSSENTFSSLFDSILASDTIAIGRITKMNGSYHWRARGCNELGCGPWSDVMSFLTVTLGVKDEIDNASISIYPNPSTGSFTISSESEYIREIRICDIEGKPLKFTPSMSKFLIHKRSVTLTEPAAGTYFVEIELETGAKIVKKIVVD